MSTLILFASVLEEKMILCGKLLSTHDGNSSKYTPYTVARIHFSIRYDALLHYKSEAIKSFLFSPEFVC